MKYLTHAMALGTLASALPYLTDNAVTILNLVGIVLVIIWLQYVRAAQESTRKSIADLKTTLEETKSKVTLCQYAIHSYHPDEPDEPDGQH